MLEVVEFLETRVLKLIEELENVRGARNLLEVENDRLKVTLADHDKLAGELNEARQQLIDFPGVREQADRVPTLVTERDGFSAALNETRAVLEGVQQSLASAEQYSREATTRANELEAQLATAQTEIERLASNSLALETQVLDARASSDNSYRQYSEAFAELVQLRSTVETADGVVQLLTGERDALAAQLNDVRAQHDETTQRALAAEQQIAQITERLAEADRRDARMRERLSVLIERIERAESYLSQMELAHETA